MSAASDGSTASNRCTASDGSVAPDGGAVADSLRLPVTGDVVFGNPASPVAVCTLASRRLLPHFAGRHEVALAGRCQTENIGVERMVQNLVANPGLRYLILCGQETTHAVGQTVLALHRDGLDEQHRVVGSRAPAPILPNLDPATLGVFQDRVAVIDLIGTRDPEQVLERAGQLAAAPSATDARSRAANAAGDQPRADIDQSPAGVDRRNADADGGNADASPPDADRPGDGIERIVAVADRQEDWEYDPTGYFLILVDRPNARLIAEHHGQGHRLLRIVEGQSAQALSQTIARLGFATVSAHLVYLGRELMKAELALTLGLRYEQGAPLDPRRPA